MTSMEMRQLEAGSSELVVLQPPLRSTTAASASSASHSVAHSTDDLSNCGSKLNLLPELESQNQETRSGRQQQRLHYSNPSCDLLPASANTHQQATSIETTFNTGAPQPEPSSSLSPIATASSNHRQANMVVNATNSAPGQQTQEMKKQRAEMKKDLQRKFERWDKETHDRTRCNWSFVFDPAGRLCYYWSIVVSLAFLYNFWVIIFRFSFAEINKDTLLIWFSLDYLMDLIYLLDIIFHFRTGYLEDGVLQTDSTKLRQHYMNSTTFYVDCLCLLPLDFLYLSLGFKSILRIFRLVKVYQFWAFMDRTERHTNYPNLLRFVSLIHYLLLVFHWNACLFHLLHYSTGFGYKLTEDSNSPWSASNYPDKDSFMTYLKSVYWTVLALTTIGDLPSPKTRADFLYVIFELVIGLITFATVLGYIANIVTNVSAARKDFQAKLDGVKTYMRLRRVPNSLQNKVIKWFDYLWLTQKSSDEEKAVSCLPDKLKGEIAIHVHLDTLKRVEIFQNTEAGFLCELVLRLRPVLFSPGDYICRKGEVGKEMYICARGRLEVVVDDGKTVLATLKAGSYFGEISILNMGTAGNRRTASVRSVGYSDLFVLSKKDMWDVLKDYPAARVRLEAIAVKRLEKYKKAPLEKAALPRSESTPGLVESRGKVPLEEMWVSPLPLYSSNQDKSSPESMSGHTSRKRTCESPCSEFSTRSQSEIQQHPTIMTSTSAVGAHGYNNEQFQSSTGSSRQQHHGHYKSKPLKQLVVTAGNGGGAGIGHHRFHHHQHSSHHPASSSQDHHRQAHPSNTHVLHQHTDHNMPSAIHHQSSEVVSHHSLPLTRPMTSSIGSSTSTVTSAGPIHEQGCSRSGGASVVHHLSEDLKKEELLLEIHRLRERIKSLETDNASMHTKLSKAQKDVSQRLAEIEMQINDNEQDGLHCFSPTELSQEDEEDEDSEINRESFI